MSWEPEIDELRRREALARKMGGPEKLARHHNQGKLDVRQRIDRLLDAGSFHEVGALAGKAEYDEAGELTDFLPANLVTGRGKVDGRPVVVSGDDFTVRGGANDAGIREKLIHVEQMANQLRLPLVRLVDGTGGGGSVKTIEMAGCTYVPAVRGWDVAMDNLSTVPVVARVAEELSKNELGGSDIHTRNGAVDDEVESEDEAFSETRRFLSYLPPSVHEVAARGPLEDDPERREDWLIDAIPRNPRRVYKMRPIIDALVDRGSFFQMGRRWGRSVITGLARLDGWPVAVLASDSHVYGGAWTADASEKVMRFVDLAETFHLPIVHLADIPGFLIGREAEQAATIRRGVRAMAAVFQCRVPWCAVLVRKVYGVAGAAHMNSSRFNLRYAWPSGDWGSLPIAGGLEAAYKAELAAADDPAQRLAEIEERLEQFRSPFRTAEQFLIEEIIDPRDTRPLLCEFANLAAPLRETGKPLFGFRP